MNETIVIGLLGFCFDDTDADQWLHEVQLVERNSGRVFNDHITYWYVETPKFSKKEEELESRLDHWLYVLTGLEKFKEIPLILGEDELFKLFFMTAETAQLMEEELMAYYASKKQEWDKFAIEETAEERGEARGQEKATLNIARAMKANGVSIDIIIKSTGLSGEEVDLL